MSWNTLSARDKSAFMNVALRHGVTDLATIKRAYNSLGDGNVMAGGGPAKTKEPPFSLAQRAAENRLRRANLFDDGGDVGDDFESRLAKINAADAVKMRTMRNIEALYDSSLPDAYSARELIKDKDSGNMYYPSELFLLDPDKQLTMMEGLGFIPGEPHDYGTVAAKVARSSNPDMPVYQRYPHDITRDEITPIGRGYRGETFDNINRPRTFQVDNGWLIGPDGHPVRFDDPEVNRAITKTLGADDWTDTKGLIDAGDYPFVLYRDDSGNFYVNAWDVNNYSDPMSPRFQNYNWWQKAGAKMLDRMGNPFVQTLGYKSLPLDDYGYAERGSGYILPNVTVTPKKKAHGGRLNKFDGLDNLGKPNQLVTAFDDLVAAKDRYAQTGDIGTSWEPVDLNDVSITDNGFITREGRVGDSFVLPEAYVYGSRPATPEQSMVARRNDGQESESLLDKLVDTAGSAVAPFLTQLIGTAAAATPSKPFVVNKKQVAGQANEPAKEALHTVKSGENLSTIARNYGVDIGDIISSNGIANPDFIKPGQQLRIPGAGNKTMHTVKSGENLSSIAKKYGVSVDRIASINGIANPDFIKPGQELRIPNVNNDTSRTLWTPKQIKEEEARINAGGNVAIIHNYHSNKGKGKVYVIDDKLHNKVHVCKDGKVIKSYNGIHSWNASEDDAMTTTYVDKHGNIRDRAGNGMTPSGVFFLSRTNNYHGAPAFMRRTQEQVRNGSKKGVPNSIHLRTMKENAVTNGCTGMDAASLRDFASRVPDGTPCYILPANSDNKFFIRNGELQFHSSDTSKVPAYNVKTSTPIERITAKANGLSDTQRGVINGFSKGLIRHKSQLQRELGLNDDTYDRLALLALGILGRESNFGEEHSAIGNFARAVTKKLNHDTSSPDYKSKYATYGANSDNNSIGLTQLRIAGLSDKERELFERFGITKDSLVYEPELAAIATMIKLGYDYVNTGQNFDNTIAHWNGNRKGYVDQVKDIIDRRFEIYKKYGNK